MTFSSNFYANVYAVQVPRLLDVVDFFFYFVSLLFPAISFSFCRNLRFVIEKQNTISSYTINFYLQKCSSFFLLLIFIYVFFSILIVFRSTNMCHTVETHYFRSLYFSMNFYHTIAFDLNVFSRFLVRCVSLSILLLFFSIFIYLARIFMFFCLFRYSFVFVDYIYSLSYT